VFSLPFIVFQATPATTAAQKTLLLFYVLNITELELAAIQQR
jgi:hypothetical protein